MKESGTITVSGPLRPAHAHSHLFACTSTEPCELGEPHVCVPDEAALARWLRRAPVRRLFARHLGGGAAPNEAYLQMATTLLDAVATEVATKPWMGSR